ncbi:MAG: MBOAT family protein [Pseudobutyrivibrio sp.]|nr:MBOAT family protein [Pseudobutyrivibrio sp.]
MLGATFFNWIFAKVISNKHSKLALGTIVVCNIALLGFFKLGNRMGLSILIPLGISYYIFKMISFQVDLYRGSITEYSLRDMASYFFFFPQIIAGPIARFSYFKDNGFLRVEDSNRPSFTTILSQVEDGLKIFTLGLFMKVIIADHIALLWSDLRTIGYESISTPLAWLGAYTYSLNLYFDFWGYSLMAAGLGVMFGFPFISNFDQPYASSSVSEFYRRWHSTLGSWFRDYVYFPLGGSRKGAFRTFINLCIVWIITGVWHGLTPNFMAWAMFICAIIILEKFLISKSKVVYAIVGRINVLVLIPISWVIFALHSLKNLRIYILRLLPVVDISKAVNTHDIFYLLEDYWIYLVIALVFAVPLWRDFYRKHKNNIFVVIGLFVMFWISIFSLSNSSGNPFMYLKF